MFKPHANLPGGYSPRDGTIDFYSRINGLVNADMVALDFGAGRAAWFEDDDIIYRRDIRTLKGRVKKFIATDVDPVVLENNSADECLIMVDNKVPLPNNSIDIIISDYVLEHIDDADAFSQEVERLLKPGGWFCARTT